jgi:glycine cleavage system H protein
MADTEAPDNCRYSKEHEWARVEGDAASVGITDYAAHELGDVVYVQLPQVGATVKQFEKLGEIESVKAVSDLFAPVSGQVVEVNHALEQNPELVNDAPFEGGWMVKVRLSDNADPGRLLDAAAYKDYLQGLD